MDAAKDIHGRMTEAVMEKVRERLPDLSTHVYNRVWEGVFDGLKNTEGLVVVEDNDWSFMARVTAMPPETRRQFYKLCDQMFFNE